MHRTFEEGQKRTHSPASLRARHPASTKASPGPGAAAPALQRALKGSGPALRPAEVLALQRAYGNRAVQRMLEARQVDAPASPRPGTPGRMVIQRSVASDLNDAESAYESAKSYQAAVEPGLGHYAQKIRDSEDYGTEAVQGLATGMASGFKSWATNYYNKAQAYLYEGQKANDFTDDRNFAVLGVDTDLNPDLEVHSWSPSPHDEAGKWTSRAVEFKASTSNYDAVHKLVGAGLAQLKKRETAGDTYGTAFGRLILTVHNDNPENPYPFTKHMVATTYGNMVANIPEQDWDTRLTTLLTSAVQLHGITTPLEVRMEHQGTRYATALFN